ncbi:MAG: mannonate dehydratase [Bacteroidota bacterium]
MNTFEQTWRWYGPEDRVSLADARMAGATGIVSALHHIPTGEVWTESEIMAHKQAIEAAGLQWSVVESLPVHEDIKRKKGHYLQWIENYQISLRNLGKCGIDTVTYNFMPLLDWTRTDLAAPMPDGSKALGFNRVHFAVFEVFMLRRKGAEAAYKAHELQSAEARFTTMTDRDKQRLINSICGSLPQPKGGYSLAFIQAELDAYAGLNDVALRSHLAEFLQEVVPVAAEANINMAIHPDDPPYPILGLPRVVSTEADAQSIMDMVDDTHNGLCFCTGSYGVRPGNDLPQMIEKLGPRIHFIHLRATKRDEEGNFFEANHLDGDVDMYAVMRKLIQEQHRRVAAGRKDFRMPFRPDHGHQMLDDLQKETIPGYSAIGRLRGLAELRGLEHGIRQSMWE